MSSSDDDEPVEPVQIPVAPNPLGLSLSVAPRETRLPEDEEERALGAGLVRLVFKMGDADDPDSYLEETLDCDCGQTVAFTKVRFMEAVSFDADRALDPANLVLRLPDGRDLMDPLSLNDYAELVPGAAVVIEALPTF
jgi:hypothetical protein